MTGIFLREQRRLSDEKFYQEKKADGGFGIHGFIVCVAQTT